MNDMTITEGKPWYREPWPWIIIGLLGTVVIASMITLWIAVSNPDALVVDDATYKKIRGDLRAQDTSDAEPVQEPAQEPAQAPVGEAADNEG